MASQSNLSVRDQPTHLSEEEYHRNQPTHLSEEEYHRNVAIAMTPGMVILGLLMLIGLYGNILDLYVYTLRLKQSTTNLFIIALAMSDIVVCSVCIPIEMVVIRYLYSFDKPWWCRILRYIVHVCVFCSVGILFAIAAVRYKIICTPFTKQITIKTAKMAIAIVCVLSSSLAVPAMVIYGSKSVNRTFTGHACAIDDNMTATPYPGLFNGMQFVIAVVGTTTLTVLYSLILRKIKSHQGNKNGRNRTKQIQPPTCIDNDNYEKNEEYTNRIPQSIDICPVISTFRNTPSTRETTKDVSRADTSAASLHDETTVGDDVASLHKPYDVNIMVVNKSTFKPKRSHRTTFMMFLITAVFVVSFIPHLGLVATNAVQKLSFEDLDGVSLAAYNIFLRTYFINSVSNPIIYSFLSDKFRREVKILFRRQTPQPGVV